MSLLKCVCLCVTGLMVVVVASEQGGLAFDARLDNVRGGACTHDWKLAITGGATYCGCSGSETNYKDDGGTNDNEMLPCGGGSASCDYPANKSGSCSGG